MRHLKALGMLWVTLAITFTCVELRAADVSGADSQDSNWLSETRQLAQAVEDSTQPVAVEQAQQGEFVHWQQRRGPAYPGDFWRSFGRDAQELPATIWDDTKATFTSPFALVMFAGAVAAGVSIDVADWNGCTADHFQRGGELNNFWDGVGDVGGNPGTHFALAGAAYFITLYNQDVKNYEISKTMINALAINGMFTMALKGVANSESPNGDDFGWPSGHTSSSFCMATVLHEAYGPWVGVPAFAFATFVGYERVDARNHDLNDVASGALIGIAIGHVVFQNHQPRIAGFDVIPVADPTTGTLGVALAKSWQ